MVIIILGNGKGKNNKKGDVKMENQAIIALVALVISELLPYIPIKSNGIVQMIVDILKRVFGSKGQTI